LLVGQYFHDTEDLFASIPPSLAVCRWKARRLLSLGPTLCFFSGQQGLAFSDPVFCVHPVSWESLHLFHPAQAWTSSGTSARFFFLFFPGFLQCPTPVRRSCEIAQSLPSGSLCFLPDRCLYCERFFVRFLYKDFYLLFVKIMGRVFTSVSSNCCFPHF